MTIENVVADVLAERKRQMDVEGWSTAHDDEHDGGEIAMAAVVYAIPDVSPLYDQREQLWPWAQRWFKPKDRRRDLVRAAALLVAEIERIDREHRT
jgi:hypothetical protein